VGSSKFEVESAKWEVGSYNRSMKTFRDAHTSAIRHRLSAISHCSLFIVSLFIASCVASPVAPNAAPSATPTGVAASLGTAAPPQALTAPAPSQSQTLRVWLPPQFAPSAETAHGKILSAQLAEFESSQKWKVETRIKKASGQGGLIHGLQASLAAAPGVAPDVIALDSQMLITVTPSLQPITLNDASDFYPFALQAVRVKDQFVAVPFAADTIGFVYLTSALTKPPTMWNDFKRENGPLWMPLGDPNAMITLQQYAALGGTMIDASGKPYLDAAVLADVLSNYQTMQSNGVLANGSIKAMNASEMWTAYREGRARLAAVTLSQYLTERARVAATTFTALPTRTGNRLAYATPWSYAIITTDPARRAAALELIRFLTTTERLGAWTFAANALPTRKGVFNVWQEGGVKNIASDSLAIIVPTPATMSALSQPVANAVQAVMNGQVSPEVAASAAAEGVNKR
jgi:ABC-type glycerol-3-phosphate transport system substrate-binding protein